MIKIKKIYFISFCFIILFFLQSGIIYLIFYETNVQIWIDSFLWSSLCFCVSFGFIVYAEGFNKNLEYDKGLIMRYMGLILVMIAFGCFMLVGM